MRKLSLLCLVLLFFFPPSLAVAQEHYTEGPIWRVFLIDVKPGKMNDFMTDLRQNVKPIYEEFKRQGVILDYTVHLKSTRSGPGDWGVAIGLKYKNYAALDGLAARTDPITLKFYSSREKRTEIASKRVENASTVSNILMREITLKDWPAAK